ncbi:CinA family protein [Pseudooceanicola sp. CBS1P-1]|uniref:Nicotinamide-nucleotide amidohydrolase family protein n=1 Tax=Pseudooceanicola albus TaxID=2692189 RepID=A0A6L7G0V9_9RHOB|nr:MULTISPECIES: CinA family protein [Pseudooceanicola]MBT9383847.1 CinA family protein [Pseudooceanicola endophyticus]MXN17701.1 nicotinamide-nucleotide amidohydrolase family protein [Pseudooceanicola albus]
MPRADDSLAAATLAACRAAKLHVATAESCTGGLVAGALTDVAGSSDVVLGGVVSYSNDAKMRLLGVQEATLAAHGAVSEEVAAQMALGAAQALGAEVAVSTTGIAGPGGSEHKPEGRVCFGIASPAGVRTETVEFGPRGRAEVRQASVEHALTLILTTVETL